MSNQDKLKIAEVAVKCFGNNSGIMLKDQKIPNKLKSDKINELIKYYGNKKININLIELLSPSDSSRAKDKPRPQNPFIIFRRNLSRGLKIANASIGTGPSSTLASEQWKVLSGEEKEFWKMLSIIAKEIHEQSYPDYKYNPVKSQVKSIKSSSNDDLSTITDNFYNPMNIDLLYNFQEFYFQPIDSIFFQNELPYDINFFDDLPLFNFI